MKKNKNNNMLEFLKGGVIIIISVYLFLLLYVFFNQEKFIFMPSREVGNPPEFLSVENVYIETEDGEKLHAWWHQQKSDAKTVLFFHGNAGNLSGRINQMKVFAELGLNALIVDYRGYGNSSGKIKEESDVYRDAKAAFNHLTKKGIAEENIILWGRSLGGAVAIDLAQDKNIFALIVESSMYSGVEVAQHYYRYLPIKWMLKYRFESGKKIANIDVPKLIMHSPDDEVIPFQQGEKLFSQANEPKYFFSLRGGHNTAFYEIYEEYLLRIRHFLNNL